MRAAARFSKFGVSFTRHDNQAPNSLVDTLNAITSNGFRCDATGRRKGAEYIAHPDLGTLLLAKWEYQGERPMREAKASIAAALGQKGGKLLHVC